MANKHMPYDLAQMQSLPLEAKIRMTKYRIREWYEHWDGMVYVSFSGGKDSTVLKHIVDSMYDDVPALFINTGLEYPEIQKFAMSQKNVVTVRPEMRFDEVLKKYGYPVISKEVSRKVHEAHSARKNGNFDNYADRQFNGTYVSKSGKTNAYSIEKWKFLLDAPFDASHKCCDVMKKKPAKQYEKETGRMPIIGTLAQESKLRYQNWLKNGCNAFDAKRQCSQPLSFWTEQDILHYLKKYNVPYCSVYGEIVAHVTGYERTGCVFCMFGCHLEKTPNRFQKIKETHPKQYEYCINGGEYVDGKWQPSREGLGLGKVLDYIGVKYD